MKVTRFPLFLLTALSAFALITATSCKKSNDSSTNGALSATIQDTVFSPSATFGTYDTTYHQWIISGIVVKSGDTAELDLGIQGPFTLNKAMDNDLGGASISWASAGGKLYYTGLGYGTASVTVSSYDSAGHKIAGSFSGTLYNAFNNNDSVILKNGKFNTTFLVGQ